jgi:TolA-binding protein
MHNTRLTSVQGHHGRAGVPGRGRSARAATALVTAVLLIILSILSCAYFNTLYNARRMYGEAEEQRVEKGDSKASRTKYEEVVKKCANLISAYPDSRWVDDALFLMGQALVRQGELNKGIRKFTELRSNFPESKYVAPALYWLALANFEKRDYLQALDFTGKYLARHPDHELRYQTMFLAGDVHLELENTEEALNFYSMVAEQAGEREVVDEAVTKSAALFYKNEDWEKAADNYRKALRKGLPSERRRELSLALGDCYTKIGKCAEAMELFDRLDEEVLTSRDKPPVLLGQAASYECMDSLSSALASYDRVTKDYPKSSFSAEAYYRMGIIYHEKMDSLVRAEEAFSKVAGEYANSPYASVALQKSSSMKRLIELQKSEGEGETRDQLADKRFLTAEIQLMRLGEIDLAIANYRAVVDSFSGTEAAPKAAYALAWIYRHERGDSIMAVDAYREVAVRYPLTPQAKGAVMELRELGEDDLVTTLAAYIDSALADTAAAWAEEEARRRKMQADSAAVDTMLAPVPAPADSAGVPEGSSLRDRDAAPDVPPRSRPARRDSLVIPLGDERPVPPDTLIERPGPTVTDTAAPDTTPTTTAPAVPDTVKTPRAPAVSDTQAAPDTLKGPHIPTGSAVPDTLNVPLPPAAPDSLEQDAGADRSGTERRNDGE